MTDPTIRLADYTRPAWEVDTVHLTFRLSPDATEVRARIRFKPGRGGDLWLDGQALDLLEAAIDGKPVAPAVGKQGLSVPAADLPKDGFEWTCTTRIDPEGNTSLEGLYLSQGMYCTQCEAEGFRRITYFPDRPDVMAIYTVRIESDLPVLLSNGNRIGSGPGWAEWHDPWPKPAYLFALVAGDLKSVTDSFTTRSGRKVDLAIWVRDGDQDRCAYAMDSLKRSMRWDEEVYGREYDLDLFQIVAVDDFNAGAMENKGLNIFNSKYVLASPETATDGDFEGIESVIAHEYFHNWTGNRITCRDWFQLSLKEGLTVFRDQCFTADMRSAPVKRIQDVQGLRAAQFREDAGPLAHPVRPEEYVEINNFYTATVYEKGAEVIRMLREIVGAEAYETALNLYFERHDGQACTIEDWLQVFEDATGRDLSQFKLWYRQAGTPQLDVEEQFDGTVHRLTFRQNVPATPGQPNKQPMPIPVRWGALDASGHEFANGLHIADAAVTTLDIPCSARPVMSLLRGFSAPVHLKQAEQVGDRAHRLAHDTDPFNRWDAGRALAMEALLDGGDTQDWCDGVGRVLEDEALDPAFRAMVLSVPGEGEIAQATALAGRVVDPDVIHARRKQVRQNLAHHLSDRLAPLRDAQQIDGPYSPDGSAPGKRALANGLLGLIALQSDGLNLAQAAFDRADNMTDSLAALTILTAHGAGKNALAHFHHRWSGVSLVIDKWFGVQARFGSIADIEALLDHTEFTWRTPNRFRALIASFAFGNPTEFHRKDGAGYQLLADWLLRMDALNPMVAARTSTAFDSWRTVTEDRQALIATQLERIASAPTLSKDTSEMIGRLRAG
ncbi:aminopeptidase N [Pontivivens insulae]|uniref:Aminopeptidase N n=1 Tax=Pontivivens insulae TaxID=1639689 RepID=A0A2R8AAE6_9RHOB|nr:aminopeptidase N [Pontivivens insulae]RED12972.1 aminopeptidase N [Pontivivens insulae]SPF29065.1 Aminopeptidase N [Pontivivens insulae]